MGLCAAVAYIRAEDCAARVVDEYEWAVRLNSVYMELIAHIEVLLRNAVHSKLTKQYPGLAPGSMTMVLSAISCSVLLGGGGVVITGM